jgi:hypothetical protein
MNDPGRLARPGLNRKGWIMKPILVQYNGKGMGTLGGKAFSPASVRELPAEFAGQCDGRIWVNLSAPAVIAAPATAATIPPAAIPSPIEGLNEAQLDEIFAALPGILGTPERCTNGGLPKVEAIEAEVGFPVSASQRNDLFGLYLERSAPPAGSDQE